MPFMQEHQLKPRVPAYGEAGLELQVPRTKRGQ